MKAERPLFAGSPSLLRAINARAVLEAAREPVTRHGLARLLGLSRPTVAAVLDSLVSAGVVEEAGVAAGRKGPAATLYVVRQGAFSGLGIDIGHNTISAGVMDAHGVIHRRVEARTPRTKQELLQTLRGVVDEARSAVTPRPDGPECVVVAVPGVVAADGRDLKYLGLTGSEDLTGADLADALGDQIEIENDVNLAAMAEGEQGETVGIANYIFLGLGAGFGMGVVLRGELHRGFSGAAGEVGSLPNPYQAFRPITGAAHVPSVLDDVLGQAPIIERAAECGLSVQRPREVFWLAREGDATALALVNEIAATLAHTIMTVAPILDPEVVVLGGPIGANGDLLLPPLMEQLTRLSPFSPKVVASRLGSEAVLLGALSRATTNARNRAFTEVTTPQQDL